MARKRKTEGKIQPKSTSKYVAIRKSSRQMAKKQLGETKINGDILQSSSSNSPDETSVNSEDQSQIVANKKGAPQKRHQKHKTINNSENSLTNSINNSDLLEFKQDAGESDSQDGLENSLQSDISPEDVRQVVVGDSNPSESTSNEVDLWSEDVIEETIICEEMEVEGDGIENNYSLGQSGNIMVEQVLLMDDINVDSKIVEYTVIQNEDGTESMVVESTNSDHTSTDRYKVIEEGVNNLHLTKSGKSIIPLKSDVKKLQTENVKESYNCNKIIENKKKVLTDTSRYLEIDKLSTKTIESELADTEFLNNSKMQKENSINSIENEKQRSLQNEVTEKLNDKLLKVEIDNSSKEIEKLVKDLSSGDIESPVETGGSSCARKSSLVLIDDESSSSILDKMEQLHQQNDFATATTLDVCEKNVKSNNFSKNQDLIFKNSFDDKNVYPNRLLLKSKNIRDKKNGNEQNKNSEHLETIEEIFGYIEVNNKNREDVKVSSSSENSNDTLSSVSSGNNLDSKMKTTNNNVESKDAEKKELQNRGSGTDTSTENGSSNSGVRRSSRIRSIGLMKQRSRGRGLVTKPNIDSQKINLIDREKLVDNIVVNQEIKTAVDNLMETQYNKENNGNKITVPLNSLAPTSNSTPTGYDSDSSKPVKVKSRWRRSSELEMGGSSAGFMSGPISAVNFTASSISESLTSTASGSSLNALEYTISGDSGSATQSNVTANSQNSSSENDANVDNVNTRISLLTTGEKDREMEERLRQFEHLRENLYLTERYTNKETKRMLCDCFLTEEEIDRGERGCGDDCLNRLLMIECGPRCIVGSRCTNKRFQNCEYAKCEVFRTEKKGFGLRAVMDLFAGEFIMEYVGEVVDPKDFRRRAKEYSKDKNKHYYFMALKSDQIIDATMKGNISRFINHSCDPNAETQKWTVNGELRIGFFNKKFITAGEEITFDYHFQRYGKEAQKCYCEAPNCRGWIGETPEEEKEKIEKKEKREKDMKKKKQEKKVLDVMEDEDLEEEIDKLCVSGLKNRVHTLTLSRLMVRSRELEHRMRLLKLIQNGEQPCRRLFLDYHGLRLIWSYVMDISSNETEEAQQFRLEVLKTLATLPIPNKTMLTNSKIYSVVEKWSKSLYLSPDGDSPEDDQTKLKISEDNNVSENSAKNNQSNSNNIPEKPDNGERSEQSEIKVENSEQGLISELATNLLSEWSNLKEVFRIPKKERIEQMKEHEREADRGYREDLEKEEKIGNSYDRYRIERLGRNDLDKRDRRRGRDSPESEYSKSKDKQERAISTIVPIPRMSKYERRQMYASMKAAKEEEERQRRIQQESWQDHESRCLALGMDPHTTAMVDPQTGYPLYFNPTLGQWQHYPIQDGTDITQQCAPVYVGNAQASAISQNSHIGTPQLSSEISPNLTTNIPSGVPPMYPLNPTPPFNQAATYPMLSHHHQPYPESQLSNNLLTIHSGTPPVGIQTQPVFTENPVEQLPNPVSTELTVPPIQPEIPPIDLPPKWKSARDTRGRTYYYHVKERIAQWLPPPPDHIGIQPDSSSSSESSEDSTSSTEDEEEIDNINSEEQKTENLAMETTASDTTSLINRYPFTKEKKRRDGLVQERIISPRREEDRVDHKKYKEIKEKIRRQREKAKLKEHNEKVKKHRHSNKSKSHSRHNPTKPQSDSPDLINMSERKIKDTFRINMANVMVHFLNPYRKSDCKQGRITNTEDFKHLARKLTHFVLAKELKHCKSVDELQCNDNVKHKAKDFVRKYMSKFGAVYQKASDED